MIPRQVLPFIRQLAKQFPAVLILGPRQCGKTTLARTFLKGEYFDLEKPSDLQVFQGDIELALRRFGGPVIFDEAQTLPALFPVLRALIDERRGAVGRFFLLGSVNPLLVTRVAETLAGRVGIVELTPFLFGETRNLKLSLADYWWRGGFPDACQAPDEAHWTLWQENYVRTFVERDVPRQGLRLSPIQMRRFVTMVAHYHGNVWNASEISRSLGVSYHTAQGYFEVLEQHFLARRLPPYQANVKKRLVKSPKVYLRDSGLLHHLLGIAGERALLESPKRGASWEGLMVEHLVAQERLERPGSQFYFYRTHTGDEVDLVVDRGQSRHGYEFKCAAAIQAGDAAQLQAAMAAGIIRDGTIVYLGTRSFELMEDIRVVAAEQLLKAQCR